MNTVGHPNEELDVSGLPTYGYGNRSLTWWGTFGMILIESTVFGLAVVTYFYLREHAALWPPHHNLPLLKYGTWTLVILLASLIPNYWTKQRAEAEDLKAVRIGLVICLAFSVAALVLRAFEFGALNTSWNESAYGSIVFALLTLHTVHLITDTVDSAVLTALMLTGPLSGHRFVDVSENALYWYFVVGSWLVIYAVIYWAPRVQY